MSIRELNEIIERAAKSREIRKEQEKQRQSEMAPEEMRQKAIDEAIERGRSCLDEGKKVKGKNK